MRRLLTSLGALATCAAMTGVAQAEYTLNILHINDFHARFQPINAYDSDCGAEAEEAGECFGGAARLLTAVEDRREALSEENVVLLSGGDQFQGSLYYTTYKSEVVADFLDELGFDATAVGNHEFDDGPSELAALIERTDVPVVGGNFDVSNEPELADMLPEHVVLEVGGERIGVIGALTPDTADISSPGENVAFESVVDYAARKVAELEKEGIDKIVMVSHLGFPLEQEVAAGVAGVDVIVGGHSNTFLSNEKDGAAGPYPYMVTNPDGQDVPIVQAYAYGKYLGELKVTWDDDGNVVSAEGEPILLDASIEKDADYQARLDELQAPIEEAMAEVVGTTTTAIDGSRESCRAGECQMGNLVTDAMLNAAGDQASIAITNGGGLRASIDEGEVTMGEILTVLPFQNTLATFEITGAGIVEALENGVSQVEEGAGRFPQVSGLQFTWDPGAEPGDRVAEVLVSENGEWVPIDEQKVYGVVTNNYVRTGGDGYSVFAEDGMNAYDGGSGLEVVVADYFGAMDGTYEPYTDGRISTVE